MQKIQTVIALGVVGIGLLLAAILGLAAYISSTAEPFHADARVIPSTIASTPPPRWASAVGRGQELVRAGISEQNLPGLSVAVGAGGELVWAEGFGWADLDGRVPVGPDTRFQIGMASKVLTSAAVGLLIERGLLDLDAEIQRYVPAYPKQPWPITLRHVLGHVSGVRTDGGDEGLPGFHCDRAVEGLPLFARRSLSFEPGTGYRYSNYGWILVSAAIEAVADEPFFRFMRTEIFEALEMAGTTVDTATDPPPDRAAFYFPRFAADPRYGHDGVRQVDYSCFAGSGAFASTPSDLVRFGLAMGRGSLVQPATVQLLQTSLRRPNGEATGYGLGWDLETVALAGSETRALGHDGEVMGGRVVSFWMFPEHDIVVAVTSNIAWSDTFSLAVGVAQAFIDGGRS